MNLLLVYAFCDASLLAAAPESEPASKAAQSAAQCDEDTGMLSVVSEGIGPDVEAAKLDAYRNAVRQAVGTYVDATTIVANDKLITDEIIVLSGAFISKAEVLTGSITKDGPFTRLRIKAEVETGKILTALHKRNVKTTSETVVIDTDSIIAELSTKEDRLRSAEKLLEKLFDGYPQKCFRASIVGAPKPTKQEGDNVELLCRVRIETDVKAWSEFSRALREVLRAISISQTTRSFTVTKRIMKDSAEKEKEIKLLFELDREILALHTSVLGQEASFLDMKQLGWPKGGYVAPPKQHHWVAVLVSDPTDGKEWEEFAIPETLVDRFPARWYYNESKNSSDKRMDGRDGLKFALVQDDRGKQIDIYNGYCKCRITTNRSSNSLNYSGIAPCFFWAAGAATVNGFPPEWSLRLSATCLGLCWSDVRRFVLFLNSWNLSRSRTNAGIARKDLTS